MKYFKHLNGVRDKYWLYKSILIMKLIIVLIVFFNLEYKSKPSIILFIANARFLLQKTLILM